MAHSFVFAKLIPSGPRKLTSTAFDAPVRQIGLGARMTEVAPSDRSNLALLQWDDDPAGRGSILKTFQLSPGCSIQKITFCFRPPSLEPRFVIR